MALESSEIALVKDSWNPARQDTTEAGILLFKGLFTKFPSYLKFFPQFSDLDIERLGENKRLLKHAIKVIDTVTFVVDAVGDETKADQLNRALVDLIKGHFKRKVGLNEFQNLGGVVIDFVCQLNNNRQAGGDQNSLVEAWTKFYGIILDLVEKEANKQS